MRMGNNGYWKPEFDHILEHAQSFEYLAPVALDVLRVMPRPTAIVCGPVGTGGAGSVEENLRNLNRTIAFLISWGHNVFNLEPFEEPIQRIKSLEKYRGNQKALFAEFYRPIFRSGLIAKAFFIHDWKTSRGAAWQHEEALRCGIGIKVIFPDLIKI